MTKAQNPIESDATLESKALAVLRVLAANAAAGNSLTIAEDWGFGSATLIDKSGAHAHVGGDFHDSDEENFAAFVDGMHDMLVAGRGLSWTSDGGRPGGDCSQKLADDAQAAVLSYLENKIDDAASLRKERDETREWIGRVGYALGVDCPPMQDGDSVADSWNRWQGAIYSHVSGRDHAGHGDVAVRHRHEIIADLVAARKRIFVLERALTAFARLMGESQGVAGLHLNGDVAPWSELRAGGRFEEWLLEYDAALAPETPFQHYPDFLTPLEWDRLREWFADPNRKPAVTSFTAGAARDAATAFEMVAKEFGTNQGPRAAVEPPLLCDWHHGNGVLVCGGMRIAREDFDTCPREEFKVQVFDWMCEALNREIESFRGWRNSQADREV